MKIKIESHGGPSDIKITNVETGEAVPDVIAVFFSANVESNGGLPRCTITQHSAHINATVDAEVVRVPLAYDAIHDIVVFEGARYSGEMLREMERKCNEETTI